MVNKHKLQLFADDSNINEISADSAIETPANLLRDPSPVDSEFEHFEIKEELIVRLIPTTKKSSRAKVCALLIIFVNQLFHYKYNTNYLGAITSIYQVYRRSV